MSTRVEFAIQPRPPASPVPGRGETSPGPPLQTSRPPPRVETHWLSAFLAGDGAPAPPGGGPIGAGIVAGAGAGTTPPGTCPVALSVMSFPASAMAATGAPNTGTFATTAETP